MSLSFLGRFAAGSAFILPPFGYLFNRLFSGVKAYIQGCMWGGWGGVYGVYGYRVYMGCIWGVYGYGVYMGCLEVR